MRGLAFKRGWGWRCNLRPASRVLDEFPICCTPMILTPPAFERTRLLVEVNKWTG